MLSPRTGLLVGLLLVLESADIAWAQEFIPARFGDARWLITSLVVPDARPPGAYDVSVTCQVIVESNGSTTTPHCLTDERYEAFRRQVIAAFDGAVVEPATINGEAVRVLMSFMVGFRCLDVCSTLLLENHGRHVDQLGFAYSAPQPVLHNGTWYEGFEEKLVWAAGGRRPDESGGVKFIVSTDINESGKASRRRIVQRSSRYRAEAARAVSSLNDVRYIPGFHEGQPLKLRLYEYWLDPDGALPDPISLPVRVHLLSSEFVDTLDAKIGESDVREFFDEVNSHWRPAGIRWEVESIMDVDAERQLAFRRITSGELAIDFTTEAYAVFSGLCPREQWLEGGWNVFRKRVSMGRDAFWRGVRGGRRVRCPWRACPAFRASAGTRRDPWRVGRTYMYISLYPGGWRSERRIPGCLRYNGYPSFPDRDRSSSSCQGRGCLPAPPPPWRRLDARWVSSETACASTHTLDGLSLRFRQIVDDDSLGYENSGAS